VYMYMKYTIFRLNSRGIAKASLDRKNRRSPLDYNMTTWVFVKLCWSSESLVVSWVFVSEAFFAIPLRFWLNEVYKLYRLSTREMTCFSRFCTLTMGPVHWYYHLEPVCRHFLNITR